MRGFGTFALGVAAGGALGALITRYLIHKNYEVRVEEEVQSVKDAFRRKLDQMEENLKTKKPEEKSEEKPKKGRYPWGGAPIQRKPELSEIVKNYTGENTKDLKPYIVDEKDFFQEKENYETISLTLYSDGVLADEIDEEMEDPEELVGTDVEACFENGADVVYIRNESLGCQYEIVQDPRTYTAVSAMKPNRIEV